MESITRVLAFCALLSLPHALHAAGFTLKTAESAPEGISEEIRQALQPKAIQLIQDGKPAIEIWLRKEVPVKSESPSLNSIPEAALLGAVAVHTDQFRDYKDNKIPPGVYTARFVLQPADGNHLGTAIYTTFAALIPAAADKQITGFDRYAPMVKASGKLTPSGHPVVLNLRPVSGEAAETPKLTEPEPEHRAIRLKLPVKTSGGEAGAIPFELVYEGHGHTY